MALVVPDVVPVFRSAEEPGRLSQPFPVLPFSVSFSAAFGERRPATELGGGLGSVVMETGRGQVPSGRPEAEMRPMSGHVPMLDTREEQLKETLCGTHLLFIILWPPLSVDCWCC